MITIPVAVANEWFKKQIDFFQFQHLEVYKKKAKDRAIVCVVNRNNIKEEIANDVDWDIKLPYKMVDSVLDLYGLEQDYYIPTNVFTAAKQIISDLRDDQVVEVIDADLVHLKPLKEPKLAFNEVIADATYEDWHLKCSTRNSEHYEVIRKYVTHNDFKYMNGGFNIIARVDTLKSIIDEVIDYSIKIGTEYKNTQIGWWQAMYGLNVACHNNKIKMIDGKNCYYPSVNNLKATHHIAHYCCDKYMDKRIINNLQPDKFPKNKFYTQVKKWLKSV